MLAVVAVAAAVGETIVAHTVSVPQLLAQLAAPAIGQICIFYVIVIKDTLLKTFLGQRMLEIRILTQINNHTVMNQEII